MAKGIMVFMANMYAIFYFKNLFKYQILAEKRIPI